jgi:hypothetical protein
MGCAPMPDIVTCCIALAFHLSQECLYGIRAEKLNQQLFKATAKLGVFLGATQVGAEANVVAANTFA